MQPHLNHGPSGQSFDMSKLSAAIPSPDDPYYHYRQPQPFIHGLGVSSPAFYPTHEISRPNIPGTAPLMPTNNVAWRQQDLDHSPVMYGRSEFQKWGVHPQQQQLATLAVSSPPRTQGAWVRSDSTQQTPPHEMRRRSVPSSPRGPPRKPKRSGYALWVGNLPPTTRIEELKDHFSAGATRDIDSVFLISKSNCAFVNYGTEIACVAAMNRFHNSRFRGRALVCRLRKTAQAAQMPAVPTSTPSELSTPPDESPSSPALTDGPLSPVIVGRKLSLQDGVRATANEKNDDESRMKIPEKFFILKSLTLEDLESSLTTRTWATQPHNENVLNQAYEESSNVYLIFSANKSGEYFGYARMTSPVSARLGFKGTGDGIATPVIDGVDEDSPRMIVTPPTNTAPKGRIIDDSARGSIFWEADHSSTPDGNVEIDGVGAGDSSGGGQFEIEWQSTTKLPFYQTRGMRNSFNGNREIKIARDGQELDPRVGRRLLLLFRASPGPALVDGVQGCTMR